MNKQIDPVCGMTVDPATAAGQYEHAGQTYYFCSTHCLHKFSADPAAYLNKAPQPQPLVQLGGKAKGLPVLQAEIHTDPVCGMKVNPATAAGRHEYQGQTYYFCNQRCLDKFRANPEAVLHPAHQPALPSDIEYTCPMHPEVVQLGPGTCPKCGMALEPKTFTLANIDAENPELTEMRRRFWFSLVLTLPVFMLAMSEMLPGQPVHNALGHTVVTWLQFALATPVVLWGGWPFFERGWASVVNRSPNMFTLIAIGTGAAFGYSVLATLAPGLFPASFR